VHGPTTYPLHTYPFVPDTDRRDKNPKGGEGRANDVSPGSSGGDAKERKTATTTLT